MTFIEVVVILLLLGVMALMVTSRVTSGTADLTAAADGISSRLRLVQTIAMNSTAGSGAFDLNPPAGPTICSTAGSVDCDMDRDAVPLPGVDTDPHDRVTISENGSIQLQANGNVAFDGFAGPFRITGGTAVSAVNPITISFRDRAGNTYAIDITPETGFIP